MTRDAYLRTIMLRTLLASASLLAATATTLPAGGYPQDDVARIDILPGWRAENGTHIAAVRVRLAPGWKTYWRAPGDAGIPPHFDWSGSTNLKTVRFHWPRPEIHEINGMRSIGYYGELVLPIEVMPSDPTRPVSLRADVELGVCQDICVPMSARVTADLTPPGAPDPAIAAALDKGPRSGREAGVGRVSCEVEPIDDGLRLTARIEVPRLGPEEVAVFELPDPRIWVSESDNRRERGILVAQSDLVPPGGQPFLLDRSTIRITVLGEGRAVEMWGCSGN